MSHRDNIMTLDLALFSHLYEMRCTLLTGNCKYLVLCSFSIVLLTDQYSLNLILNINLLSTVFYVV